MGSLTRFAAADLGDGMFEAHAYRAYEIGDDGHVIGRTALLCLCDETALERAQRLVKDKPIELWDGACLLARFEPQTEGCPNLAPSLPPF